MRKKSVLKALTAMLLLATSAGHLLHAQEAQPYQGVVGRTLAQSKEWWPEPVKAPAGAPDRDYKKTDAMVLAMVPDRSHKAQAPPPLVPTGKWTPAESLDHFLKSRAKTIEYMKTTPDLREHVVTEDPLGQPMDGYEFLLFIGAHSERHTKQILEVKADPNFPKM